MPKEKKVIEAEVIDIKQYVVPEQVKALNTPLDISVDEQQKELLILKEHLSNVIINDKKNYKHYKAIKQKLDKYATAVMRYRIDVPKEYLTEFYNTIEPHETLAKEVFEVAKTKLAEFDTWARAQRQKLVDTLIDDSIKKNENYEDVIKSVSAYDKEAHQFLVDEVMKDEYLNLGSFSKDELTLRDKVIIDITSNIEDFMANISRASYNSDLFYEFMSLEVGSKTLIKAMDLVEIKQKEAEEKAKIKEEQQRLAEERKQNEVLSAPKVSITTDFKKPEVETFNKTYVFQNLTDEQYIIVLKSLAKLQTEGIIYESID